MAEWLEDLQDQLKQPWEPATWPTFAAALAFPVLVLLVREPNGWTPFLDGVNLIFHEAGHPLFGLFHWETLTILGGTLMELLVPSALCLAFVWKRQPLGTALCGQWAAQNLLYIACYMADARAQELPLAGGGEHDWTALLSQWGLLERDTVLAGRVAFLGWTLMLAWVGWLGWRLWVRQRDGLDVGR
jgi:hypothetical protein